jgi:enoyl-CoA hydratase/carnithine racemase
MKQANAEALRTVMSVESQHFIERLQSPEAAEAFQAFLEHRQPDFSRFQ